MLFRSTHPAVDDATVLQREEDLALTGVDGHNRHTAEEEAQEEFEQGFHSGLTHN